MKWWLNPKRWWQTVRESRRVAKGGGPKLVRLKGIGHPKGWILPAAPVRLEIETRDGTIVNLEPAVPVPFPYAWSYRLARYLGVPLVSDIDPEKIAVQLRMPGRRGR